MGDNPQPSATLGSRPASMNGGDPGAIVVGGETLTVGQQTVINGHTASAASIAIVIDGSTTVPYSFAAAASPNDPAVTPVQEPHGSQTDQVPDTFDPTESNTYTTSGLSIFTAASLSRSNDMDQTGSLAIIPDGATAIIYSQKIGTALLNTPEGPTTALSSATVASIASSTVIFTMGSEIITATPIAGPGPGNGYQTGSSDNVGVRSTTVANGILISAAPGSTATDGTHDGSFLAFSASASTRALAEAIFTAGGHTVTAHESSIDADKTVAIIDGSTLGIGDAPTTISGLRLLLDPNEIIINGSSTVSFTAPSVSTTNGNAEAILTIGSHTLTASEVTGDSDEAVVDGTTMTLGGSAAVVDGQTISMASGGLVIGVHGVHLPNTTAICPKGGAQTSDAAATTTPGVGASESYAKMTSSTGPISPVTTSDGCRARTVEIGTYLRFCALIWISSSLRRLLIS